MITISREEFFGSSGGPRKRVPPKVFIAYRFSVTPSVAFKERLRLLLEPDCRILEGGDVPAGDQWAPTIRKRISGAKLFIADVTGPSREVAFEMGHAAGKAAIYVVRSAEDRSKLPGWVAAAQIPAYDGVGTDHIAGNVRGTLFGGTLPRPLVRGRPGVGKVLVLRAKGADWARPVVDAVASAADEFVLNSMVVDPADVMSSEDLRELADNWLVVAALDGTRGDLLAHFLIGDQLGRPDTGSGTGLGERLRRHAVLFTRQDGDVQDLVADAVNRVPSRQRTLASRDADVVTAVRAQMSSYRRFLNP